MTTTLNRNALTLDDIKQRISFPMDERPVFTVDSNGDEIMIPHKKAIVRLDGLNNEGLQREIPLSIVGKDYKLVNYEEAIMPSLEAISNHSYEILQLSLYKQGSKMIVEAVNRDQQVMINGDLHIPRVMIMNSVDGSCAIRAVFGLYRLVCFNGSIATTSDRSEGFTTFHHKNALEDLKHWRSILSSTSWLTEYRNILESFNTPLLESDAKSVLRSVFAIGAHNQETDNKNVLKALELAYSGIGQDGSLTKWSVLQGVTETLKGYMDKANDLNSYQRITRSNQLITKTQKLLLSLN